MNKMIIEKRAPTFLEYTKLRRLVGWWDTDKAATELALKNAIFSVVITQGNLAIGIGRLIGDGGLYYYVQDIMVHPDYQAKGIGKLLMKAIMSFISSNAKKGAFVGLMAANGLETYYHQFGFKARAVNAPGMFLRIE